MGHLVVTLALATRTGPMEWLDALEEDPRLVATALALLEPKGGPRG